MKQWLDTNGFATEDVFLDFDHDSGIPPGADWEKTLYNAIMRCHAIILILTPNWMDSKWCFAEFTYARALGKAIFPVIFSPTGERFVAENIQQLDLTRDREGGLLRLSRELGRVTRDTRRNFGWDPTRAPYPGMMHFEEDDAAIYFGRDEEVRRFIERLKARSTLGGTRILALLGASGSGKSSFLRAGVVPNLRLDRKNWIVLPVVRPRDQPLEALARCLAEALDSGEDWKAIQADLVQGDPEACLSRISAELRQRAEAPHAEILLIIDQAEELLDAERTEHARKVLKLINLAAASISNAYIVTLGLRADYLAALQRAPELIAGFEAVSLEPIPSARYGQLVRGPAQVAGLKVSDDLVSAIVEDAKAEDALPLLAIALHELYERSANTGTLTVDSYKALASVDGHSSPLQNIVRRIADEALTGSRPSEREAAAFIDAFVFNLVRLDDNGTFVRRIARWDKIPKEAQRLFRAMEAARLIKIREDQTLEVAHEALLREWPKLVGWLEQYRSFLAWRTTLAGHRKTWEETSDSFKKESLLSDIEVDKARTWLLRFHHRWPPLKFSRLSWSGIFAPRRQWNKINLERARTILDDQDAAYVAESFERYYGATIIGSILSFGILGGFVATLIVLIDQSFNWGITPAALGNWRGLLKAEWLAHRQDELLATAVVSLTVLALLIPSLIYRRGMSRRKKIKKQLRIEDADDVTIEKLKA